MRFVQTFLKAAPEKRVAVRPAPPQARQELIKPNPAMTQVHAAQPAMSFDESGDQGTPAAVQVLPRRAGPTSRRGQATSTGCCSRATAGRQPMRRACHRTAGRPRGGVAHTPQTDKGTPAAALAYPKLAQCRSDCWMGAQRQPLAVGARWPSPLARRNGQVIAAQRHLANRSIRADHVGLTVQLR